MIIIDLNNPLDGTVNFKKFSYPDGQPHIEFALDAVTIGTERSSIELIATIRNGHDLLNTLVAVDALYSAVSNNYGALNLNISYLLGARMDRRVAPGQPATLAVVAAALNTIKGLTHLRILDAHSAATFAALPTRFSKLST